MSIPKSSLSYDLIYEGDKVVGADIRPTSTGGLVTVLGTTLSCSIRTGEAVSSFTVHRSDIVTGPKDVDILAVLVQSSHGPITEGFIFVDWSDEEKPFGSERGLLLPRSRGMVQIIQGRIDLTVGDELFTTNMVKAQEGRWDVIYYLPDGDLLCAYLVEQVDVEQLRDNAGDIEEQIKATELNDRFIAENNELVERNKDLDSRREKLARELNQYLIAANFWHSRFSRVAREIRKHEGFFFRSLNRVLDKAYEGEYDEFDQGDRRNVLSCVPTMSEHSQPLSLP